MSETLIIPANVGPTPLEVEVHAVHYTEENAFGAFLRVHGDNSVIVGEDGSINLFFSPEGFRHLLKTMVEVLVFKPGEVNEQVEEVQADAAALGPDDGEGL